MRPLTKSRRSPSHHSRQRGVVLFFALIALLAMSLAAVALVRSVDTNTLIAGNIAFKQSTTASSDSGVEAAIAWLTAQNTANAGLNVLIDITHPFNNNAPASGYYSNVNYNLNLTNSNGTHINWDNTDSVAVNPDASGNPQPDAAGNTTRYIIQRMCRTANTVARDAGCLFTSIPNSLDEEDVKLPQEICDGPGCPSAGQSPQLRITARTLGAKGTISYVQAFVY